MHIIQRNFFRLLRAGAFGSEEEIEAMSAWKWGQVLDLSARHHIEMFTRAGVKRCSSQFFMQLTDDVDTKWEEAASQQAEKRQQRLHYITELLGTLDGMQLRPILIGGWSTALLCGVNWIEDTVVPIFFPFDTQGQKADAWAENEAGEVKKPRSHVVQYEWRGLKVEHRHRLTQLNNKLNDTTLQRIIEQERREESPTFIEYKGQRIETIDPTLSLLVALTEIVRSMLGGGITTMQIIDMGTQLRKRGHRVDFLKLQGWITRLHLERVARLAMELLTELMGFSVDEVPFVENKEKSTPADELADALLTLNGQKTKYFRYLPGESIASIFTSVAHSLDQVEE